MKYLIAGLGNVGPEYELTRHNAGFLILDRLADVHKVTFDLQRHAEKAELKYKGKQLHLIKPTTYMNLSGKAVAYWLQELGIPKENLLVVVDEIALPFGTLRMRAKGSSAGHNGLKNIELLLNGQDYSRLRFGVGDDFHCQGAEFFHVFGGLFDSVRGICQHFFTHSLKGLRHRRSHVFNLNHIRIS